MRISDHGDPDQSRHELFQDLQAFALIASLKKLNPVTFPPGRDRLATRPRPTGSVATMTIGMVLVVFLAANAAGCGYHQDINFETNKLCHQLGYPLQRPLSPADLQRDRLPFHVAQFSEPLLECPEGVLSRRGVTAGNVTDPCDFRRRLCADGQRPDRRSNRRATQERDEIAAASCPPPVQ